MKNRFFKEKNTIKKVIKMLSIVLVICSFTACTSSETKDTSILSTDEGKSADLNLDSAKTLMTENIENYSFVMESEISGYVTTTTGKEDLVNKIIYSESEVNGVSSKQYNDYGNGYIYLNVSTMDGWIKTSMDTDDEEEDSGDEYLAYIQFIGFITDVETFDVNDGKKYVGTINFDEIDDTVEISEDNIDMFSEDTTLEVFVNSKGYVENIVLDTVSNGYDIKIDITYTNINTTGEIVIPTDIKNS